MRNRPTMLLSKARDWVRTKEGGWLSADAIIHMKVVRAEQAWAIRLTDTNGDTHLLHLVFRTEEEAIDQLDSLAGVPEQAP